MILSPAQQQAIASPHDAALVSIEGEAGSGKTYTLMQRAIGIATSLPEDRSVLLSSPNADTLAELRSLCVAENDSRFSFRLLGDLAFTVVEREAHLIDDLQATRIFERAAEGLLSLEWEAFTRADIDPEVAGLRTPERFVAAAYRLIRKLCMAHINPEEFEAICLRGNTNFYEHLPDLGSLDLIERTPAQYRDSLRIDRAEAQRQRRRENDLAAILTLLYKRYCTLLIAEGSYTLFDALAEATKRMRFDRTLRQNFIDRYPHTCIDDAQDLTTGELYFLQAIYGRELHGVTIAGDARQATRTFAGARGERTFTVAKQRFILQEQYRCPAAIVNVARRALDKRAPIHLAENDVTLHRVVTVQAEAEHIANTIATLIANGTSTQQIAIIARSIRCVDPYIAALLDCDIPLDIGGDAQLYLFESVRDALAVLWSVADPYRHDHLLRMLEMPCLGLCDASIALLCSSPLPRNLGLCRNVIQGESDADLPEETRHRLALFRTAHERWETLTHTVDPATLARTILAEAITFDNPQSARARFESGLLARLIEEIEMFTEREPLGSLHGFLQEAERVAQTDEELHAVTQRCRQAVSFLSVEAAKARSFEHVFVIDTRAAGFVRYYVPDAFLFYPSLGMIAKENVGENACAARTAKFTYALYKFSTRERYVEEERRAFAYAATRASKHLHISSSGSPTRGNAAPELLEELRSADIPGVAIYRNQARVS
jgi:superfamily I DNA/RNA helicase